MTRTVLSRHSTYDEAEQALGSLALAYLQAFDTGIISPLPRYQIRRMAQGFALVVRS